LFHINRLEEEGVGRVVYTTPCSEGRGGVGGYTTDIKLTYYKDHEKINVMKCVTCQYCKIK